MTVGSPKPVKGRRLGGLLSHQLPDPTEAFSPAINLFLFFIKYFIYPMFQFSCSLHLYATKLISQIPFDSHVLGLPLAFTQSQDQTQGFLTFQIHHNFFIRLKKFILIS